MEIEGPYDGTWGAFYGDQVTRSRGEKAQIEFDGGWTTINWVDYHDDQIVISISDGEHEYHEDDETTWRYQR